MVHAQQMKDGGVKVVNRDRLLFRLIAELIAGADRLSALIPAPAIQMLMAPGL
jgi:hypothetical protein